MRFRATHHTVPGTPCFAGEENDDRLLVVEAAGLALLADAGGPTYGGYHLPIALDGALDLLREQLADSGRTLDQAFRAVNAWLHVHALELNAFMVGRTGLEAALQASQRLARERFQRPVATFVHLCASITAVRLGPTGLEVGQLGSSRAYLVQATKVRLLLPDHLLSTVCPGADPEGVHGSVCTRLLGIRPEIEVDTACVPVAPGDRVLVCGDGVWKAERELVEILAAHGEPEATVRALVGLGAKTHDDATAVLLEVMAPVIPSR
jgi:protein phosphatase